MSLLFLLNTVYTVSHMITSYLATRLLAYIYQLIWKQYIQTDFVNPIYWFLTKSYMSACTYYETSFLEKIGISPPIDQEFILLFLGV